MCKQALKIEREQQLSRGKDSGQSRGTDAEL